MTSPAAATRPAGDPSPRRVRSPAVATSPPSPLTTAERIGANVAAEFGIATPERQTVSNPGTPVRAAPPESETIAMLMKELTAQLAVANGLIQELEGLLGGARKELEMHDKMAELKVQHEVLVVQNEWNVQRQRSEELASSAKSSTARQPPAPSKAQPVAEPVADKANSPEPVAAKAICASAPAKEDLLPDPRKLATNTPPGIAKPDEDVGVPLRSPHSKDFDRPSQYGGSLETWASWAKNFKQYMGLRDSR